MLIKHFAASLRYYLGYYTWVISSLSNSSLHKYDFVGLLPKKLVLPLTPGSLNYIPSWNFNVSWKRFAAPGIGRTFSTFLQSLREILRERVVRFIWSMSHRHHCLGVFEYVHHGGISGLAIALNYVHTKTTAITKNKSEK